MEKEERKIRLIAHCMFDGWLNKRKKSRYAIGFSNKNIVLINQFKKDIKVLYLLNNIYTRIRKNGVIELELCNKKIFEDLFNSTNNLDNLLNSDRKISIFLKTFWDDEGNVNFYPQINNKKLRGKCCNKQLLNKLLILHKKLGLTVKRDYDNQGLIITDKENIIRFKKLIGFSKGVKIGKGNGIGKNVWFNFQKNIVLNKMINFYKINK